MRAWLMDSYDGVEKLRLGEVADPRPGPGQVLLRVRFAALNPADAFLAQAMYPARPPLPHILGRDGVGDILAVGPGVDSARVGDTVGVLRGSMGVEVWGTLAEKVVVPAANLVPIPRAWSLEETAAAPLVFLTAWQALTQWSDPPAPPRAGSVLLVTGASGGVGTASLLLGKSMNLTVLALSRSADRGAKLKELGADFVFGTEEQNLYKTVRAAIAPRAVDLAVDTIGGPLFNEVVKMLGHGGRISVVGRSGGVVPEFNTATLFFRRIASAASRWATMCRRRRKPRGGRSSIVSMRWENGPSWTGFPLRRCAGVLPAIGARTDGKGAGAGSRLSV